jgi:hypothetical protein
MLALVVLRPVLVVVLGRQGAALERQGPGQGQVVCKSHTPSRLFGQKWAKPQQLLSEANYIEVQTKDW